MKVLVAGASGVIGKQLVPMLEAAGHEVVGLARSVRGQMGTTALAVDALDRDAVVDVVMENQPDAVVNLLTALPDRITHKRIDADFVMTNRLRKVGTENLRFAAQRAGVRHFICQSIAFGYEPRGTTLADEKAALWRDPPKPFDVILDGVKRLEAITVAARGTVLRFGHLYGPGTGFASDGWFFNDVERGKMPLVADGNATFSFLHVHDAAQAVLAALQADQPGVFNIVDDEPAQVREWLPALAQMMGAPEPKRVSAVLAGYAVGTWGVAYMTRLRGADNTQAKHTLKWQPRYPSWRDGFAAELAAVGGTS
ncbi:NAD(P)-dependent oxidoreductase [Enteractinococcus fodinae]|uniref:Nucleoside-diphosphate-sugar epimerase n=1 Tax=Enteractinococcus fodinae TaxID=684663 RepID=A0ABU2B3C0_9MICC|nr:NAD(P)-dependent oxidoreductase [Enteractinococcus fodinae]MDR7348095.1 nucleoside-diphosphate-sugar epimerase [Enteractinococcus fodinae]